jgi:large conductance mechanosensitive channel
MKQILAGFRDFIAKGNAIDLAVGVVIGSAFTALVNALVEKLIMPLVAAIFGKPDFNAVGNFTINGADFSLGAVLTAIVNFLLVAIALYFFIVLPFNKLRDVQAKHKAANAPEAAADTRTELDVLKEIQAALAEQQGGATSKGAHSA